MKSIHKLLFGIITVLLLSVLVMAVSYIEVGTTVIGSNNITTDFISNINTDNIIVENSDTQAAVIIDENSKNGRLTLYEDMGAIVSERVVLNADGDSYFTDNLGIGISSPNGLIHSASSNSINTLLIDTYDNGGTESRIKLRKSDSDIIGTILETGSGDELGRIEFLGVDNTNTYDTGVVIRAIQDGASGVRVPTDLEMFTYSSTSDNAGQFVLNSNGDISMISLTGSYSGGSAHVCVTNGGILFSSEAPCP